MYSHLHLKIYTTKGLERVHQNVGVTAAGSQDREFYFLPSYYFSTRSLISNYYTYNGSLFKNNF